MKLLEALSKRRSVRLFKNKDIEISKLNKILESATLAPTGGNIQPWFFILITEKIGLENISNFSPGIIETPKAAVVACTDISRIKKENVSDEDKIVSIIDLSMACQNMMLAALDYGLGTCSIRSFNKAAITKLLNLPTSIEPQLIITIGYPKEQPRKPLKLDFNQVVNYGKYGVKEYE